MDTQPDSTVPSGANSDTGGSVVLAWLVVGIPLAWGVSQTFLKALTLFK